VTSKLHHIQALRGIAASMVVVDHAMGPLVKHGVLPTYFDTVRYNFGALGVDIFFVISGFIMIRTSGEDFGSLQNSLSFAMKRIIRIVPIYWVTTLLIFLFHTHVGGSANVYELFKSLLFIPYAAGDRLLMEPLLGPGWTLNYEMFFYALFSLALIFPRRIGLPGLFIAFAGITVGGAALRPLSDASNPSTILTFWSHPIILLFAAGVCIGSLERKFRGSFHLSYSFQIACILIASQVFAVIVFRIPADLPFSGAALFWAPDILAVAVCVVEAQASGSRFEFYAERIGDASYSTYITHVFVLAALNKVLPISTAVLSATYLIVALLGSNLVGIFVNRSFEIPVTSFLRNSLWGTRKRIGSAA